MPRPSASGGRKPAAKIKIEVRAVADLVQDPENAKVHDTLNLNVIRGSLRKYGQQKPLVISRDGVVVAGNGTLAAAILEGWDWIECKVFQGDTAHARAYAIVDNRSSELARWESDMLAAAMRVLPPELQATTGFTELEIDKLLQPETPPTPGDAPPSGGDEQWGLIVECKDERQQVDLMERLEAEGFEVRPLIGGG